MNKLIVGNLKMNLETKSQRDDYCLKSYEIFKKLTKETENKIVFCPPIAHLDHFVNVIGKLPSVGFGAQDSFWELHGSYTGNNSPKTVTSLGGKYVILGHSERREYNLESDEVVMKKALMALRSELIPIVCVGYVSDGGDEMENIKRQINVIADNLTPEEFAKIVFAYEPVWAIGSGKTPTTEEIHTVVMFIRNVISKRYSQELSSQTRIIYGGSVTPDNVADICHNAYVQGVLVGGASLNPEVFARLVQMLN